MTGTSGSIAFFTLAVVGIFSALIVVTGRNLFHNALFLGVFLLCIAGLYLLLSADFLAVVQVAVYIGGIMVLILFGIMLSKLTEVREQAVGQRIAALVVAFLLTRLTVSVINRTVFPIAKDFKIGASTPTIGKLLLSDYFLPFEVIAVVLLAAVIGAIAIIQEEKKK